MNDEDIEIELDNDDVEVDITENETVNIGTRNYEELENQPQINDVVLIGNKSLDDLGIQEAGEYPDSKLTNTELEEMFSDWN